MDWVILSPRFELRYRNEKFLDSLAELDAFMARMENTVSLPTPHSTMPYVKDDPRSVFYAAHMMIRLDGDTPRIYGNPPEEPSFYEQAPEDAVF